MQTLHPGETLLHATHKSYSLGIQLQFLYLDATKR